MTREVRTRIEGARELDRVLKMLPRQFRQKELEGALMTASNPLRKAFQSAAASRPRQQRSGVLARTVTRTKMRRTMFSAEVKVGWFRRGFFAVFEEERSPFARPAWEAKKGEVLEGLGVALGQRLERAAKRIAGDFRSSGLGARRLRRRRR